jgi:predicted nucleotidyltransferase
MYRDYKDHGETALIMRNDIRHYEIGKYQREFLQATSIMIEEWSQWLHYYLSYALPKHVIKKEHYIIFKILGNRFIAARDYNAKYTEYRY